MTDWRCQSYLFVASVGPTGEIYGHGQTVRCTRVHGHTTDVDSPHIWDWDTVKLQWHRKHPLDLGPVRAHQWEDA